MSIVYRSVKGSKLTSNEVDANFQYLESLVGGTGNSIVHQGGFNLEGSNLTFSFGWIWKILGQTYTNASSVTISIPLAAAGKSRIDLIIANTSNTFVRIPGEESETNPLAPPVPLNALQVTFVQVSDGDVTASGPITGTQFKTKIENTRYKSTLSGENVIIPFQAAGQSHYSVTNATLVSVAGFTTAGLTTPMYEGQDVIFENQTGHEITLKDSFGVDTSFVIGADLIVPNEGKIWFRFRNNELELIDKNWFKINEVATDQNLGEFIYGLDSKTDIKDDDEFILSDSEDSLKSKKTRFLDLKTKLKSYFDTFYLSLSVFNDFVTDVFDSLDNKLDKSTTPSSVYGTNTTGGQTMIPFSTLQPSLISGTNIKTLEGQSLLGSGNINLTSNDVGLGNVDNTSDVDKPISTATQEALVLRAEATQIALNLKENLSNKATNLNSPDNIKYPTTLAVVNENKKATITVELINQLTTDFYAPNALRINSTTLISGSGTLVLKVNDVAYTLGNLIPQGAKITAETTSSSVYNLISVYE